MILVPMDTPGVKLVRPLTVFGQDGRIMPVITSSWAIDIFLFSHNYCLFAHNRDKCTFLNLTSFSCFCADAIHGGHFEVHFENVRVPVSNIILGKTLYCCVFVSFLRSALHL